VYVDDIVFGGSSNSLVARFADDMSREFEMSMMGVFVHELHAPSIPEPAPTTTDPAHPPAG
jgi:hypothetical protein